MIERKIIIGAIVSTDYLKQIQDIWDVKYFESSVAKKIGRWIWDYFLLYDKAPGKNMEAIFFDKLKSDKNLSKDVAEEIEEDILPGLSQEYELENFNLDYMLDQTREYFNERSLEMHTAIIAAHLLKGNLLEAEQEACEYKPLATSSANELDLSKEIVLEKIEKAFTTDIEPLIRYPGAIGKLWNDELIRGSFVALMGPEKRGKTWHLLDFAIRACKQKKKVAFFQAGDMSEGQQLKRICIYEAGKSNLEKFCKKMYQPVVDCIKNQNNDCEKSERECNFGVFEGKDYSDIKGLYQEELIRAWKENKDYVPCKACEQFNVNSWGVPWIKEIKETKPLTVKQAQEAIEKYFIKYKVQFKISTHANDTLTINTINSTLDIWEKQDDFIADVIVIDYADLLILDYHEVDSRQKENKIWKGLRNLSQTRGNPLVITATQADAKSYTTNQLGMTNFSEDKRKLAHVTAMWGLNQDTKDREKQIGIMRINEIVIREGENLHTREVKILQNLKRGKPFLGSYW